MTHGDYALISVLELSLLCAAAAVMVCLIPAAAVAMLLARKRFWGKAIIELIVMLPIVFPPVVTGYLLLWALGGRGVIGSVLEAWGVSLAFTWRGAVAAQAVIALPFMVLTMREAFASIKPDLEWAARGLGAQRWRVFRRVTLPLAWPGMVAGCVLAFARALGEFGATIIIAGNIRGQTRTLPLAIFTAIQTPGRESDVAVMVLVAVALACTTLMLHRLLIRRETRFSSR